MKRGIIIILICLILPVGWILASYSSQSPLRPPVRHKSQNQLVSKKAESSLLTLAFVGDIMMGTTFPETSSKTYLPQKQGKEIFQDAKEILRSADVACGNLEGTLFDGDGKLKQTDDPSVTYAFKTPVNYAVNLKEAGFDFMSLANNHTLDFGPEGIESTKTALNQQGIKFAGINSAPTATKIINGKRIGLVAFGYNRGNILTHNKEKVRQIIGDLKKDNDIVVVSFHGGAEGAKHTHVPRATEKAFGEDRGDVYKFAHTAIDAGADIVYGHGPHVPRAMELYKDKLIMYSLGNFATPYRISISGISGYAPLVMVKVNENGNFAEGQIHSFIQQKGIGPRKDEKNKAAKLIKKLTSEDFPGTKLKISDSGVITKSK